MFDGYFANVQNVYYQDLTSYGIFNYAVLSFAAIGLVTVICCVKRVLGNFWHNAVLSNNELKEALDLALEMNSYPVQISHILGTIFMLGHDPQQNFINIRKELSRRVINGSLKEISIGSYIPSSSRLAIEGASNPENEKPMEQQLQEIIRKYESENAVLLELLNVKQSAVSINFGIS